MQTPTGQRSRSWRWARCLGTGAAAVVAATAVASTAGAATTNAPLGANGSVAAITGTSMEVQNPASGQTTVNWTPTTQFSKTVTESVSSITVGNCVTATGTPSKSSKTTISVRSITLTPSTTGSCAGGPGHTAAGGSVSGGGGFGFRTGAGGGGFPARGGSSSGKRPSFPNSGNFRKEFASIAIASGKVTGVNGSTITVSGINISPGSFTKSSSKTSKSSKSSKRPTLPKTQTLKLTTSSTTTVSATQSTASSALAVGDCVSALGPAASNGSVTADTVRITSTTAGASCTGGFSRFGGGGPGGGGGQFFGGAPGGGGA